MSAATLPHLFVVRTGNTLPTTGTTNVLTPGQFGIYKDDANDNPVAATAANAGTANWIQIFQGNEVAIISKNNKRSDRIFKSDILEWYKVASYAPTANQVTTITNLSAVGGEDINVTLRVFSKYINDSYYNGLLRTVTVQAACLECGEDPCESQVTDQTYTDLAAAINNDPILKQYVTAAASGTVAGANATVTITGKALTNPVPNATSDPFNDPYFADRLYFFTYVHRSLELSADYETFDRCDIPGTVNTTARSLFKQNTPAEVRLMEIQYYSYSAMYKELFHDSSFNQEFVSQVDAAAYDLFYIKFKMRESQTWHGIMPMDEQVILAVPSALSAGIQAVLAAYLGAPKDKSITAAVAATPVQP